MSTKMSRLGSRMLGSKLRASHKLSRSSMAELHPSSWLQEYPGFLPLPFLAVTTFTALLSFCPKGDLFLTLCSADGRRVRAQLYIARCPRPVWTSLYVFIPKHIFLNIVFLLSESFQILPKCYLESFSLLFPNYLSSCQLFFLSFHDEEYFPLWELFS